LTKRDAVIVGLDLARRVENPTGWATVKNKVVSARHFFSDREIIKEIMNCDPTLTAIDAPLSLPRDKELTRKADREMQKREYPVFPPSFRTMGKLTLCTIKLAKQIKQEGLKVIEVHPASTRKALKMPTKDWNSIQSIFIDLSLKGDVATRTLSPHEIDATTAALTGWLRLKQKTELIGDRREGYIVVPLKTSWRRLKL
jgi:predicted nuclease with RNAse H fold